MLFNVRYRKLKKVPKATLASKLKFKEKPRNINNIKANEDIGSRILEIKKFKFESKEFRENIAPKIHKITIAIMNKVSAGLNSKSTLAKYLDISIDIAESKDKNKTFFNCDRFLLKDKELIAKPEKSAQV